MPLVVCQEEKWGSGGRGWTCEALEAPGFRQSPPTPATPRFGYDGARMIQSIEVDELIQIERHQTELIERFVGGQTVL